VETAWPADNISGKAHKAIFEYTDPRLLERVLQAAAKAINRHQCERTYG